VAAGSDVVGGSVTEDDDEVVEVDPGGAAVVPDRVRCRG